MLCIINFIWICVVLSILIPVGIVTLIVSIHHANKDKRELRRYRRMEKKAYTKLIKSMTR